MLQAQGNESYDLNAAVTSQLVLINKSLIEERAKNEVLQKEIAELKMSKKTGKKNDYTC